MAAHITLQHSSMEFSLTPKQHEHDAKAVFTLDSDVITGTESGHTNSLFRQIPDAGHAAGYWVWVHPYGEWVAVAHSFGKVTDHGFIHVLDSYPGPAGQGGHSPRGIVWARIEPKIGFGAVTVGVAHWLTQPDEQREPGSNAKLETALGHFAADTGAGRDLCFVNGDTNLNDRRVDVFGGAAPLTTCWDELGVWPSTHGPSGGTIDMISSYNHDRRVTCRSAHAYPDTELRLNSDHQTIRATYAVAVAERNRP